MNPLNQPTPALAPTPRTDAAWNASFDLPEWGSGVTARAMHEECATLERELARLRAEVERWKTVAAEMSQEREHNANERDRADAEVAAFKKLLFGFGQLTEESFRGASKGDFRK